MVVTKETIINHEQLSRNEPVKRDTEKRPVLRQATLSWPSGRQNKRKARRGRANPGMKSTDHIPGWKVERKRTI